MCHLAWLSTSKTSFYYELNPALAIDYQENSYAIRVLDTSNIQQPFTLEAYVYEIPLKIRFRDIEMRSGVLLRGEAGWSEGSPFLNYDIPYSARWLFGAIEQALLPFPEPLRTRIPVNVTIPAVDGQTAFELVKKSGANTAKVKVAQTGQNIADDYERLLAVREALGKLGNIRIDVNGRWDTDTAIKNINFLERAATEFEYVEQPCMSVEELALVRRKVNAPIAADESIRQADDPLAVKRLAAADIAVLKNQPLGGVRATLALAEKLGLPTVVSSALETSVGLRAGLALAATLPQLDHACGLGTSTLFVNDVTASPLRADKGYMDLCDVTPDVLLTAQTGKTPRPTPATYSYWQKRFAQMWEYLQTQKLIPQNAQYVWK